MGKILIILGSYFPKPSPNGICVQQIANSLQNHGVEIDIISIRSKGLSDFEVIDGTNIYRVKGRWIHRMLEWCEESKGKGFIGVVKKALLLINKFKNFLFIPIWPLISPIYSYRVYKRAIRLQQTNQYEGVIAVYNPIDALIVGTFLKRKNKDIKLMLYFLDTLSGGIAPKYFSNNWLQNRGWFWEEKFFKWADLIFIMESHRKHYFRKKFEKFHDKIKVVDIPLLKNINFVNENVNVTFDKNKLNLVYTGSLLKNLKNPSYMLTILKKINEFDYIFHFFGGGDCGDILDNFRKDGLNDSIVIHGQVDISEAHNSLLEADILINIGSSVDHQIPSKIFEYISSGKPIISFYKRESEPSIPYLKKYSLALLIKEDWEKLDENALRISEFINQVKGKSVDFKEVKEIFCNNTPEPMVQNIISNNNSTPVQLKR